MSLNISYWTFAADAPLHPYFYAVFPGDSTTLAMSEYVNLDSTGERITAVSLDLRNAANTTTLQTITYSPLSTKFYQAKVTFTGLTPGTTYQIRVRATGSVSGATTLASRRFVWAVGEIVYPVSLGADPFGLSLEYEIYNPTASTLPPVIMYAPADGPLVTDITGPFTGSPPTSFPSPAYVHIRVRLYDDTQLSRMDFAWRAS